MPSLKNQHNIWKKLLRTIIKINTIIQSFNLFYSLFRQRIYFERLNVKTKVRFFNFLNRQKHVYFWIFFIYAYHKPFKKWSVFIKNSKRVFLRWFCNAVYNAHIHIAQKWDEKHKDSLNYRFLENVILFVWDVLR